MHRCRYHFDDFVEQISDVLGGRVIIFPHPSVFGRTIDHREVELLLRGIEVAHQVEHHFIHLLGSAVGLVHLVHHHHGLQSDLQSLLQHKACLRHGSFKGIDQQNASVCHVEHTFHLSAEVGVPRSVDDVDFCALIVDGNVFREDGDAPFALQVIIVEHQVVGLLVGAEQVSGIKHFVDKRGFPVVNVCNDGNVANVWHTIMF